LGAPGTKEEMITLGENGAGHVNIRKHKREKDESHVMGQKTNKPGRENEGRKKMIEAGGSSSTVHPS